MQETLGLEKEFKSGLERVIDETDIEPAIENLKEVYDWVGYVIWDVYRFIGEDAARRAASTLVGYDSLLAAQISQHLRPSDKTSEEQKQLIQSVYSFLGNDEISALVNNFPEIEPATLLNKDPIINLVNYAAAKEPDFREAIINLVRTYSKNPEVVSTALSLKTKGFPQYVQLLSSETISGIIKSHLGNTTRHKLVLNTVDRTSITSSDFLGFGALENLLSALDPNYFPKSQIQFTKDNEERTATKLQKLSDFLMERVEPLLEKYKRRQQQFVNLAYEINEVQINKRPYWNFSDRVTKYHPLDTFLSIIDNAPSIEIGLDIANVSLDIWKGAREEREERIYRVIKALESPHFRGALVQADVHPLRNIALKGLTYTAHRPNLKITENVSLMLTRSSYTNISELDNFFNLVKDEGVYLKQLYRLPQIDAPLADKTAALRLYVSIKKSGIGINDPSTEVSWKENSTRRAKEALLQRASQSLFGDGKIDILTKQDIYGMSTEELVEYLNIRTPDRDMSINYSSADFFDHESFLVGLPGSRERKGEYWQLGKVYGTLTNKKNMIYSPVELTDLLVSGLIGRIPERIDAAREVFGSNLDLARNYVLGRQSSKKAYHVLKPYLDEVHEGNYDAIQNVVNYFREFLRGETLKGNKNRRKLEALSDITEDIAGVIMESAPISLLTAKMQNVVPTDLFDNRTLHCCTFYPTGIRKEDSFELLGDPRISMLYFMSEQENNLAKRGVAILLRETLENDKLALIVDSLEGSPHLRYIDGWTNFAFKTISKVASDIGAETIIINEGVMGNTAKNFVKYIDAKEDTLKGFFPLQGDIRRLSGLECITYNDRKFGVKGYAISVM